MSIILKAENISKQYRLGTVGTGTLSHDLNRWWHQIRGKEDPYLKLGAVNDRNSKATEDYVWALREIDFEVKQGEVLGIIGKNGAGKSTLLKILSRVTTPTKGSIKTKGRIASLLEIGTGFHPELTGRENIFMNGAVLGMTKTEIKAKLNEIIAFSGCEMFIDTPVKRYSSGMTVRLGFAVAAHLEPEILVVDEVLAVGDAEFQKKAIGKMQDLSTGEGRTVLFVSHNMVSIQNLCSRALSLEKGLLRKEGNVSDVVEDYLEYQNKIAKKDFFNINPSKEAYIKSFRVESNVKTGSVLKCSTVIISKFKFQGLFAFTFSSESGQPIYQVFSGHVGESFEFEPGENKLEIEIKKLPIIHGIYQVNLWLGNGALAMDFHKEAFYLRVDEGKIRNGGPISSKNGYPVIENANWHLRNG